MDFDCRLRLLNRQLPRNFVQPILLAAHGFAPPGLDDDAAAGIEAFYDRIDDDLEQEGWRGLNCTRKRSPAPLLPDLAPFSFD